MESADTDAEIKEGYFGWRLIDYLFIPLLIIGLAFEPNFLNGWVDYLESGQYLGPIGGIFRGEVPYRDSYTLFGPLFLYIPAGFMVLFGKTIAVLRTYFHISAILNLLIAYFLARIVCKKRYVYYAIPLVLLLEYFHPFWSTRWGGLRVGLGLLVVGGLIGYVKEFKRRPLIAAAILGGIGLLYSTDVGLVSLIVASALAVWLVLTRQRSFIEVVKDWLFFITVFLAVTLPLLIFFAVQGALGPYLQIAFMDMPTHHMAVWAHDGPPSIFVMHQQAKSLWVLMLSEPFKVYLPALFYVITIPYLIVQWIRRLVNYETTVLFVLTAFGSLLYVMAFRAIDGPQFQMALPPLIIALGWCIERCIGSVRVSLRNKPPAILIIIFCVIFIFGSVGYILASQKRYYGNLTNWIFYQQHKQMFSSSYSSPVRVSDLDWVRLRCERCGSIRVQTFQADEIDGVAQFLLEHTEPGEAVFTFPEHGIFNFLSNRPNVSRFAIAGYAWTTQIWQDELLDDLRRDQPRYAVVGKGLSNLASSIKRDTEIFPEVGSYLAEHYQPIRDFSTVAVLKRK